MISQSVLAQVKDPKATEVWKPFEKFNLEKRGLPPSDAIILFDTNLDAWQSRWKKGEDAAWKVENGYHGGSKRQR